MADAPAMGGAAATALPITMSQQAFEDPEDPRCFVLVDGQAVGMVPGSSEVQQLLSEQEAGLAEAGEAGKGGEVVVQAGDEVDKTVTEEKRFEEVLRGMNEGKMEVTGTVEVVHVEGGKTLEVMHIDTGKPLQVIHIEGGGKLDLEGGYRGDNVKVVVPPSTTSLPYRAREGQAREAVQRVSHIAGTPENRSHATQGLCSLGQSVTQPVIVSSGKGGLVPSHSYCRLPPISVLPAFRKAQGVASQNIDPNIIISGGNKDVLRGAGMPLDNAIIISWPSIPQQQQQLKNTVGTQTEACDHLGPSFNLFFCTFHADGSVETHCDFPSKYNKSVSTDNRTRCRDRMKLGGHYPKEEEGGALLTTEGKEEEEEELRQREKSQRFSRSGRILKGKGITMLKAAMGASEEDLKGDPDFEVPEEEEETVEAAPKSLPYRRKRGRKRKRRPPSPDGFEEELQLAVKEKEEGEGQQVKVEVKEEVDIVDEVVDESEVALEIMRKKGYGLRTKRRPKKMTDMHYLQEQLVRRQQPDQDRLLSCHVCDRSFPTFFRLQRHAKQEHGFTSFSFPCDVCGMVFTRPHNLERHKDTKHSAGQKRYACEFCNSRFSRPDVLSVHVSNVHLRRASEQKGPPAPAGTHHCTGCDNYFTREKRLSEHRRGDFTCGECNIGFECRTALRLHRYRSHPTACRECGKMCSSMQQMYIHRQSHAPKFVCKFCNKGFMWRSLYTVHMATHTGDRSVPCDVCGKTFAHKIAVSKHKWQEHNENNKKFKCEQCGKCFVYRGKLASHMRSHTGEKPYTCQACNSTFSQRSNLTAHIKSVHGVVVKSVKSDGTTHTELVKYKRPKKAPATPSVPPPPHSSAEVGATGLPQEVELPPAPPQPPHIDIQGQVHMSESSLETEAAVYQIVYAYP